MHANSAHVVVTLSRTGAPSGTYPWFQPLETPNRTKQEETTDGNMQNDTQQCNKRDIQSQEDAASSTNGKRRRFCGRNKLPELTFELVMTDKKSSCVRLQPANCQADGGVLLICSGFVRLHLFSYVWVYKAPTVIKHGRIAVRLSKSNLATNGIKKLFYWCDARPVLREKNSVYMGLLSVSTRLFIWLYSINVRGNLSFASPGSM